MVIAAIYPIFRRIKMFRWLASNTMWFDFHLMAGTVGPMFIALHSALKLDYVGVSAAFWSMVIVVVSGFLGRYLYTQVPELSSGVELEELDHERAFQTARPRLPVPMAEIDRELAEHRDERAAGRDVAERAGRAVLAARRRTSARPHLPRTSPAARAGRLKQLGVDRRTRARISRAARHA